MPQPQNYSHPDLTEILSICYEALNYSPHPELYNQAMTDFIGVQPDKQERDPITGENAPKATIPGTVSKITSNIEKLYMDTTQNLGLTDPAAQPFQHAMRTMYRNYFLLALNGGSVERQKRYNPFLIALRGRIPDLIGPDKFTGRPPVQDPDQLWQELKDPARELSGFEEMETVMKKVPLPKLLQALSNGSILLYDAIENHAGMNPKEQEDTRTQMLDFVREAKHTAAELKGLSREDMKAFSKVFAPHNRKLAVDMQWYGQRGLDTVAVQLESLETVLKNHVPFSHLDTIMSLLDTAKGLEKGFEAAGAENLQGIQQLREENRKLLELLTADFSGFSPEEAAAHMNKIGEAAASRTNALRIVHENLPPFKVLPQNEQANLSREKKAEYDRNNILHTVFNLKNASGNKMTDAYLTGKLTGNTSLKVPKAVPQAPRINNNVNPQAPRNNNNAEPQAEEAFDQGPHFTTVMPEGKAKNYTAATLGEYVAEVFTFKDYMGTGFFSEEHQMRGMDLQARFSVGVVLPWDAKEYQTLFNHVGEAPIANYLKSAHDEALKSYLKCSREKAPLTYAVRSFAEMVTALSYSGELPEKEVTFNPFYSSLKGRLPDLIKQEQFTGNPPETDPEKLIQQLGQPGRELSGPEELEVLCKRLPIGELMAELADNAKRLRAFREAGPEMSAQEKENLRQEMLHGCSKIQELGAKFKTLSEQELTALSKMYSPHNRETALQMNTLGARGIDLTVLQPMAQMSRILAANVPADRISAYLGAYSILEKAKTLVDQENTDKSTGMLSLLSDGGAAYKEKMNGLLAQFAQDLSGKTEEEKKQHFEALADGMTEFLRMGEECTKHFPYLPSGPAGRPKDPRKQRADDLKQAMAKWSPKPEFIVGALRNGDHYDFNNQPAALPAAPAPQEAQNDEPEEKAPANTQELIDLFSVKLEMLSSIYQHLHEEGHSRGVDSEEYKNFRNAVKAIHKAWNPPETRTIDLSTREGRDHVRQMLDVAVNTANVYYHKHAGRTDISSTYGNVRKNAALTTIDILAPKVVKEYIARGMETGMNMTRDGVIIKQKIGMEELVRNEKAFAALKYANKNSRAYQQTAEKTLQAYQRKEEREAKEQKREASQIRKEDAVNTFLSRRNHR